MFLLALCATLFSCAAQIEENTQKTEAPAELTYYPTCELQEPLPGSEDLWFISCAFTSCASYDWLGELTQECFTQCATGEDLLEKLESDGNINELVPQVIKAYTACEQVDIRELLKAGDRVSRALYGAKERISPPVDRAIKRAPPFMQERMIQAWISALIKATEPQMHDWSGELDKNLLYRRAMKLAGATQENNAPRDTILRELVRIQEPFLTHFSGSSQEMERRNVKESIKRLEEESYR